MVTSSISEVFAEWIAGLEFADIPAAVIADVPPRVLDNLGIQLASLELPSTQAVLETVSAWGGEAQASVPGLERQLPAPSAAFAGGVMGNSFDYDDTHTPSMLHVHAVTISAALAATEAGTRTGREALVAIVAGFETVARRPRRSDPVRAPGRPAVVLRRSVWCHRCGLPRHGAGRAPSAQRPWPRRQPGERPVAIGG